jgi:molybdopterin-synthase adenylyltransferase
MTDCGPLPGTTEFRSTSSSGGRSAPGRTGCSLLGRGSAARRTWSTPIIDTDQLSAEELERYARQIGPGVLSAEGQLRLKRSTALISRVGGIGGPAALTLTMAGVGRVIIAHGGSLSSPDLNRQLLGSEPALGKARAGEFAARLRAMNRFVEVETLDHEPDDGEAVDLARRSDVILACPPTFAERLRLNRAAVQAGVPLIDAAQWGMTGTLIVVLPGQTACLLCLYPQPPPFEELFPVVGAISCAIGSLAALEAIKILSGSGQPMWGRMFTYDGFQGRTASLQLTRKPACACCGGGSRA